VTGGRLIAWRSDGRSRSVGGGRRTGLRLSADS